MRATSTPTLLIVDHKNLLYRSTHVHARLFSRRVFTGALYGVMVSVLRAVHDTGATAVVVATDSPPYRRKDEFEGYKSDRKKQKDDPDTEVFLKKAAASDPLVRKWYACVGIPLWEVPGYEYDDVCAWAVDRYKDRYPRIVAMTNDSDLYQLFDVPAFSVYKSVAKGEYTRDSFVREFGELTREDWITFLSLTGTHNAVPGVHGVGAVTARKALERPGVMRELLAKHSDVIERNRRLIQLPHPTFPKDPGLYIRKHRYSTRDVTMFCHEYEINLTGSMLAALQDLRFVDVQ